MPRIFLSYAHDDLTEAESLSLALACYPNISVWRDKNALVGGEAWERRIRDEIVAADYFVPLISHSFIDHPRFAHKEVTIAVEERSKRPQGSRFIVPVRLDESDLFFDDLKGLHSIDLFKNRQHALHMLFSALGAYGETPGAETKIRVTAHQARFRIAPRMYYFINVANISDRPVSITHVHYQDPSQYISVTPQARRLPFRLDVADVWATYLPVDHLPTEFRENAYDKFFVRLGTGDLKRSVKEDSILSEGSVPGGSIIFPDSNKYPRAY